MQLACTHFLRRRLKLVTAVEGPVTVHEVCVTADILDAATNEPWMRSSTTTQDPTTRVWITAASSASELEPRERHTTAVTGDLTNFQPFEGEQHLSVREAPRCSGGASSSSSTNFLDLVGPESALKLARELSLQNRSACWRKGPDTECPTLRIRLPRTRRPATWDKIDDSVVL